jgi:hypothetical protein
MATDRLGSIVAFVRVAEVRSFAKAAKVLGVSSSAVSKSVARLEDRLELRLFQRTTRALSLTGFVRARASLRICDVGAPFVHAPCMMASASFAALAKRERRREAGTIWL